MWNEQLLYFPVFRLKPEELSNSWCFLIDFYCENIVKCLAFLQLIDAIYGCKNFLNFHFATDRRIGRDGSYVLVVSFIFAGMSTLYIFTSEYYLC